MTQTNDKTSQIRRIRVITTCTLVTYLPLGLTQYYVNVNINVPICKWSSASVRLRVCRWACVYVSVSACVVACLRVIVLA